MTAAQTVWLVLQGAFALPQERDEQLLLAGPAREIEAAAEQTEAVDEGSPLLHAQVSLYKLRMLAGLAFLCQWQAWLSFANVADRPRWVLQRNHLALCRRARLQSSSDMMSSSCRRQLTGMRQQMHAQRSRLPR